MTIIETLLIAVGLAMDAFAVSMGAGTTKYLEAGRAKFRISFHFGLFQFLMPVSGWFLGINIAGMISSVDHWIAFIVLVVIGGKMVYSGFFPDTPKFQDNPSKGLSLVILSVATSLDALAVGFSLAMIKIRIWFPSVIIGIVACVFSISGIQLGRKLSDRFGKRMELIGGMILILIGLKILLTDLKVL
jgi:putative Mn2+ efflux pump MntP